MHQRNDEGLAAAAGVARTMVGCLVSTATKLAKNAGYSLRVVEQDGQQLMCQHGLGSEPAERPLPRRPGY
jgi:hypothetical protein